MSFQLMTTLQYPFYGSAEIIFLMSLISKAILVAISKGLCFNILAAGKQTKAKSPMGGFKSTGKSGQFIFLVIVEIFFKISSIWSVTLLLTNMLY
jgi:hypothetical protein